MISQVVKPCICMLNIVYVLSAFLKLNFFFIVDNLFANYHLSRVSVVQIIQDSTIIRKQNHAIYLLMEGKIAFVLGHRIYNKLDFFFFCF